MARITKVQEKAMFGFLTWIYDHHQYDFRYLRKLNSATDRLIELGQDTDTDHSPPFTLASSRGQKLAIRVARQVDAWKKSIAYMAWTLQQVGYAIAEAARESRSRDLAKALVDVILTRSAMRRNPEVILCFESAQVALQALTGEKVSLNTVRSLLELLSKAKASPFKVTFARRGEFRRATKILVLLPVHSDEVVDLAQKLKHQVDDWLLDRGQWIVRVMQHEAKLRATHDVRIAEYRSRTSQLAEEVEQYLRQHAQRSQEGRSYSADLPGVDLFEAGKQRAAQPHPGVTILTSDSAGPESRVDLRKQENGQSTSAPFCTDPETYFWELEWEWRREQIRASSDPDHAQDQADYDRRMRSLTAGMVL